MTFETPMLWAIAFVILFTIGGFSGLMLAIVPADFQYHDTYFVVAHFHYVLVTGALFAHHRRACTTGGRSGPAACTTRRCGKFHFWWSMVFVNLLFFPQHFLGLAGMPRRIPDYNVVFADWNMVSSIGAFGMFATPFIMLRHPVAARCSSGAKADGARVGRRARPGVDGAVAGRRTTRFTTPPVIKRRRPGARRLRAHGLRLTARRRRRDAMHDATHADAPTSRRAPQARAAHCVGDRPASRWRSTSAFLLSVMLARMSAPDDAQAAFGIGKMVLRRARRVRLHLRAGAAVPHRLREGVRRAPRNARPSTRAAGRDGQRRAHGDRAVRRRRELQAAVGRSSRSRRRCRCTRASSTRRSYFARNTSDRAIVGNAVPSVAPARASGYFSKTECFCFTAQTLGAGEGRDDAGALHRRSGPAGRRQHDHAVLYLLQERCARPRSSTRRRLRRACRTRRPEPLTHTDRKPAMAQAHEHHDANAYYVPHGSRWPVVALGRAVHHDARRRQLAQRSQLGQAGVLRRHRAVLPRSCSSGSATSSANRCAATTTSRSTPRSAWGWCGSSSPR